MLSAIKYFAISAVGSDNVNESPWWIVAIVLAVLVFIILIIVCAKRKKEYYLTICYGKGNKVKILVHEGDNIRKEVNKIKFTMSTAKPYENGCLLEVKKGRIKQIYADAKHKWIFTDKATVRGDMTVYCTVENIKTDKQRNNRKSVNIIYYV